MAYTYWRLNILDAGTYAALSEWSFYDGSGTLIPTTGGTASASSSTFGAAANAFDGNTSTFWNAGGPATAASPSWLQYQFTSAVSPASYKLTGRIGSYAIGSWQLLASNDGVTWVSQGFYSSPDLQGSTTESFTIDVSQGTGTAWRLLVTSGQTAGSFVNVAEWNLNDLSGNPISMTGGYAVATDQYDQQRPPAAAVDGNASSFWASASSPSAGSPVYLEYAFSSDVTTVGSVTMQVNSSIYAHGPQTFAIQFSQDGTTWYTVGTYTAGSWGGGVLSQAFGILPFQRGNIDFDQIRASARTGNGSQLLSYTTPAPSTHSAFGNPGQVAYDASGNWYWCYATNSWARIGPGGYSNSF